MLRAATLASNDQFVWITEPCTREAASAHIFNFAYDHPNALVIVLNSTDELCFDELLWLINERYRVTGKVLFGPRCFFPSEMLYTCDDSNARRESIEFGEPGDHNKPYHEIGTAKDREPVGEWRKRLEGIFDRTRIKDITPNDNAHESTPRS